MYLHLFDHTNILHIFILFIHCKFIHSLSLTFINMCTNSTHALTCMLTFSPQRVNAKKSLQNSLTFHSLGFLCWMSSCTSTKICLIILRKQLLQKFYLFNSSNSVSLCLNLSLQVVTPQYQEVQNLDNFTLYITSISIPTDRIYFSPTFS